MLIAEMLRKHRKKDLLIAITGDDIEKFNYSVNRVTTQKSIELMIFGNTFFDAGKSGRRVIWLYERLKRLSDGQT